jgi:hypothetical protein
MSVNRESRRNRWWNQSENITAKTDRRANRHARALGRDLPPVRTAVDSLLREPMWSHIPSHRRKKGEIKKRGASTVQSHLDRCGKITEKLSVER